MLLNPAPARLLPEELLSLPDFLVPNESELSLLTNQPVNDIPSAEKAAKLLLERGVQNVIVTLGANGALIVSKGTTKHIPSFQVDVVDTTAAGDAFIGGFAIRLTTKQIAGRSRPLWMRLWRACDDQIRRSALVAHERRC